MTGYSGNFQVSRLKEAKDICMIAGGTGWYIKYISNDKGDQ